MLIAATALAFASAAHGATATFDFSGATVYSNLPQSFWVNGVTGTFTGPFSIQNASTTFLTLSQLSNNYLYPNLTTATLTIAFDRPLNSITLTFATTDLPAHFEIPTTMQLTAYQNSTATPVGSATATGTYTTDSLPQGTLSFNAGVQWFNLVELRVAQTPPPNVRNFLVDNVIVTAPNPPHKAGVFRPWNGTWYLDTNGNGAWDGCGIDACAQWGGDPSDQVVLGDWDGTATTKIGVYRAGTWYLDTNGNGAWDGCGIDACIAWGGDPADKVVLGDWNGYGTTKIGVYRAGTWYLDTNGNGAWDGCGTDGCVNWGGDPSDTPVVGIW
jgi:hypothetical protein